MAKLQNNKKNESVFLVYGRRFCVAFSFLILFSIFIFAGFVSAGSIYIDDAKDKVDKYYLYSQQNDVDSFSEIFDSNFLVNLYGSDYNDLFSETFSYFDINSYEIDFQKYTEGEGSFTLFYNVKADTSIEGESIEMDNDMVAFFTKKGNELKLRYVMLQEVFVEKMNQETAIKAVVSTFGEEAVDLSTEYENYDQLLNELDEEYGLSEDEIDEVFEERLEQQEGRSYFVYLLIVFVLLISVFLFAKITTGKENTLHYERMSSLKKNVRNSYDKTKPVVVSNVRTFATKSKDFGITSYKKAKPKIKAFTKKAYNKTKPVVVNSYNKTKPVVVKYSKKAYNKTKPVVVNSYNKTKPIVVKNSKKAYEFTRDTTKKGIEKTKSFFGKDKKKGKHD